MVRYLSLFLLLLNISFSWAQVHPQGHQHLQEVLDYEHNLKDSYPIYLGIPEGLDEDQPLHFYQNSREGVARLSTYYFRRNDSLVTKSIHQWSNFDDLFKPNRPWLHEELGKLKNKYKNLQGELSIYFGSEMKLHEEKDPASGIYSEMINWNIPLLYNPVIEYRELNRKNDAYGVITLAYIHQGWEDTFLKQLDFMQYYFFAKIKENDFEATRKLLSKPLQQEIKKEHIEELQNVIDQYELELYNTKEGISDLEREYIYMYKLTDESGNIQYTLNIAFNNNQDIIFLQYNPIQE